MQSCKPFFRHWLRVLPYIVAKMYHLNAPFSDYNIRSLTSPQKVTKMLDNVHHRHSGFLNNFNAYKNVKWDNNKLVV